MDTTSMRCCISQLILYIIVFNLLCVCRAQYEDSLRRVAPPYQFNFNINQISGHAKTYGPKGSMDDGGKFYRTLALQDNKLLVGGKASLFSANPQDLETLDFASIQQQSDFRIPCNSEEYCDNYIRVIQPLRDGVFLECGTNSLMPYCQQRSTQNLSVTFGSRRTTKVVPSVPNQNSSWLLVNDIDSGYQIFAGTNLKNSMLGNLLHPAIVRANLETTSSDTMITNSLTTKNNLDYVLNNPQFVGDPIEYNGGIYFFFREYASEHINSGRIVYSRVARICKNEKGGDRFMLYEGNFVTFMKARLDCSIAGAHPYHYNQIQDIYHSTVDQRVVFAIFSTGPTGVASSAVCAYRLDEIESLFLASPFKAQVRGNVQNLWLTVRRPLVHLRRNCPVNTSYSTEKYLEILSFAQLLDNPVRNMLHYDKERTGRHDPLLVSSRERFTRIVVEENVNSVDVFFIGTENGTVLKAFLDENRSEARIVEQISLTTNGLKKPVLKMLKSDSHQAVFVGTDVGVYKIPLHHCTDYTTNKTCRYSNCHWIQGTCTNSTTDGWQGPPGNGNDNGQQNGILIIRKPQNQTRFGRLPNKPVNMYLVARASAGSNLRVVGDMIRCDPPANLSFTQRKSTSSGHEFLLLHIDGSPIRNSSCPCYLATDDGAEATVNFNISVDNSSEHTLTDGALAELRIYDKEVLKHKYRQRRWTSKMIKRCDLNDKHICSAGNII